MAVDGICLPAPSSEPERWRQQVAQSNTGPVFLPERDREAPALRLLALKPVRAEVPRLCHVVLEFKYGGGNMKQGMLLGLLSGALLVGCMSAGVEVMPE